VYLFKKRRGQPNRNITAHICDVTDRWPTCFHDNFAACSCNVFATTKLVEVKKKNHGNKGTIS